MNFIKLPNLPQGQKNGDIIVPDKDIGLLEKDQMYFVIDNKKKLVQTVSGGSNVYTEIDWLEDFISDVNVTVSAPGVHVLEWIPIGSNPPSSFEIFRSPHPINSKNKGTKIGTTQANSFQDSYPGVAPGVKYYYAIKGNSKTFFVENEVQSDLANQWVTYSVNLGSATNPNSSKYIYSRDHTFLQGSLYDNEVQASGEQITEKPFWRIAGPNYNTYYNAFEFGIGLNGFEGYSVGDTIYQIETEHGKTPWVRATADPDEYDIRYYKNPTPNSMQVPPIPFSVVSAGGTINLPIKVNQLLIDQLPREYTYEFIAVTDQETEGVVTGYMSGVNDDDANPPNSFAQGEMLSNVEDVLGNPEGIYWYNSPNYYNPNNPTIKFVFYNSVIDAIIGQCTQNGTKLDLTLDINGYEIEIKGLNNSNKISELYSRTLSLEEYNSLPSAGKVIMNITLNFNLKD